MTQRTPLHLITGLLGSGKTTLIRHLLKQKPAKERWGVILNDFGPLAIDSALLNDADEVIEVRGGCICCTAHHSLRQALDALLKKQPHRILVEPTGVSHPAEMTDLFLHHPHLDVQAIVTVMTPHQLTDARWKKSELMRQLAMLADIVILNKVDLATAEAIDQAERLLRQQPRPPQRIVHTTHARCPISQLLLPHQPLPPLLWQHEPHGCTRFEPHPAELPGLLEAQRGMSDELTVTGYRFSAEAVFSRPALRQAFTASPPLRAKGLLRTGKYWQSLQWADESLQLQETAWQRDSRLLVFFENPAQIAPFEEALKSAIHLKLAQ